MNLIVITLNNFRPPLTQDRKTPILSNKNI